MKYRYAMRTRLGPKGAIVAEFLPPSRKTRTDKVVILLDGAPTLPGKGKAVFEIFTKLGYWVLYPRYRGAWESDGVFLGDSPEKDVALVMDHLESKSFRDAWSGEEYRINPTEFVLIGGSFGGPAALLQSRDARVSKVITISAVVDWTAPSTIEPLSVFFSFSREGFGNGYRFSKDAHQKLASGIFYNPMPHADSIPGAKILMIHAKDDLSVLPLPVTRFAKRTCAKLMLRARGGHLGFSALLTPSIQNAVVKFLTKKGAYRRAV